MSKIQLNNIVNTQNVQLINDNFDKISKVINEKMLSRKPEGEPNTLQEPLDLNNQRLLNVPKPTQPTDVVRLQDVQDLSGGDVSGKQDTLVSGVNIKTVNNESLLGSGNITIAGGGGASDWVSRTGAFAAASNTNYYVTVSSTVNVTLVSPTAGKFYSVSNNPASTASIRISKPGITVSSSKGTVGTTDDILVAPGQHFYAYATSSTLLRIPTNG